MQFIISIVKTPLYTEARRIYHIRSWHFLSQESTLSHNSLRKCRQSTKQFATTFGVRVFGACSYHMNISNDLTPPTLTPTVPLMHTCNKPSPTLAPKRQGISWTVRLPPIKQATSRNHFHCHPHLITSQAAHHPSISSPPLHNKHLGMCSRVHSAVLTGSQMHCPVHWMV